MLSNFALTPLVKLQDDLFNANDVQVYIKKLYLTDTCISGNKWYKLKHNLTAAKEKNKSVLLTFGGAYSNHIAATAAAGRRFGFKTIGIIRGEAHHPLNHTLRQASNDGMHLHYISREHYRSKEKPGFIETLTKQFGDFYLIPEGGANELGVKGCKEIVDELPADFSHLCCPCGTGTTLAGLIQGLKPGQQATGIAVLKGASFLNREVCSYLNGTDNSQPGFSNWHINTDYHFGGYAKTTPLLTAFISQFESKHAIPLDFVYTAKLMFGVYDLIGKGYFKRRETIIALHTGGLQGNYMHVK